jgi:hypothetical protein
MHTSGRAGLRFHRAFHLRGTGTTADVRIGCPLPEEICQIRQISVCRRAYPAIGADDSVCGLSALLRIGVGSARFDARAAYSVGVPRAGHCACAQCCTEPRGGGNTHTDFSLYENALAFNPRSRPAPGEVDHQYPRLRPKYPPPPPNSSSSTTIIRINSIGVSFNCAGVITAH